MHKKATGSSPKDWGSESINFSHKKATLIFILGGATLHPSWTSQGIVK
jgi:hypothetical protein